MRGTRIARPILIASLVVLPACGRDGPSAPTLHSITGRVRLVGQLVADNGRPAGTRTVDDADGVRIELIYGENVVATTTTRGGVYRLTGIGPGGYRVRALGASGFLDQTPPITVSSFDFAVGDTLRLASQGDLLPVPNPFATSVEVFFAMYETRSATVDIVDLSGGLVRRLTSREFDLGLSSVRWNGTDSLGQRVPTGLYWVTLLGDGDVRAHLLFR